MIMVTLSRSPAMAAQLVKENVFIKSKSSNGRIMILRPGVVNLKIHPIWTWGEWDPHLFLPWDQTLCRAAVWPPEAIIDVPSFLPYPKLFLEKILRSGYQGNTFDCWFSAARWRGALQSRSWLPIRKTLEAFLLGQHLCCESFNEKNWKTSIFYYTSGASTSLCKRYSTISKLPAHKILNEIHLDNNHWDGHATFNLTTFTSNVKRILVLLVLHQKFLEMSFCLCHSL